MGHEEQDKALRDRVDAFLASLPAAIDLANGDRGVGRAALAKTMRSDIARALKQGLLPAGTEVSVRKRDWNSYTVEIVAWVGSPFIDAYYEHLLDPDGTKWDPAYWDHDETLVSIAGFRSGHKEYVRSLNEALYTLDRIVERHNYNRSQIEVDYFDVGYYMTVCANTVAGMAHAAIELERNPEHADKLARAKIAAETLGKACVKSVCGKRGVDGCSKWDLDRLLRIAERANGQPVAYDKQRRGWFPVASTEAN